MDYRSLMKDSFSEMRKYSSQTVMVTQSLTSFGRNKPRPAFQDWIEHLNRNVSQEVSQYKQIQPADLCVPQRRISQPLDVMVILSLNVKGRGVVAPRP
ncbi:hypothetical protein L8S23_21365 [Enterobacter bugandensis]|uniref:hypothetical protein n=1 Tax=Enterobacter bugandensis TaxID=881260 RepID=UPI002003B233|nr:hypothetical protein [Enterobacter bugandensis]MCK6879728.1 hypothetical protein [Enterobacter bugandensis]